MSVLIIYYLKGGDLMIDIHSHIIPFVDDGSQTMEDSIRLIENEVLSGVTDIVLTPHYDISRNYVTSNEVIDSNFALLKTEVKKQNINVNLYLGRELHLEPRIWHLVEKGEIKTLNGSRYVLLELFDNVFPFDIDEIIFEFSVGKFKIILAHPERYTYLSFNDLVRWKARGIYLQVNAASFFSTNKDWIKLMSKLLKAKLIDFVASDVHTFRKNMMLEAYNYVSKVCGVDYAIKIFETNGRKVLNNEPI